MYVCMYLLYVPHVGYIPYVCSIDQMVPSGNFMWFHVAMENHHKFS